jgi:hypothetical protein
MMLRIAGLAFLAWIAFGAPVHADTVYLRSGESVWGSETYEEGDVVVVVRPGGKVRIPKAQVSRIDSLKSSLPPFYSPPGAPGPGGPLAEPGAPAIPEAGPPATAGSVPPVSGGTPPASELPGTAPAPRPVTPPGLQPPPVSPGR